MTEIETDKPYETNKPYSYVWGPPNFMPDIFFLVEEQSEAEGPVQADRTSIFLGVKCLSVS